MALDEDLADRMRAVLAGTGAVREVKMFGGLCFMLNGNMVAGTSRRGLLVRVGKDRHAQALARPGAKPMEMSGRPMEGYVFIDPPPPDEQGCGIGSNSQLRSWTPCRQSSRNRSAGLVGPVKPCEAEREALARCCLISPPYPGGRPFRIWSSATTLC
jgi:hypothetical protein